jgi:hypothetical protein
MLLWLFGLTPCKFIGLFWNDDPIQFSNNLIPFLAYGGCLQLRFILKGLAFESPPISLRKLKRNLSQFFFFFPSWRVSNLQPSICYHLPWSWRKAPTIFLWQLNPRRFKLKIEWRGIDLFAIRHGRLLNPVS